MKKKMYVDPKFIILFTNSYSFDLKFEMNPNFSLINESTH